MSTAPDRAHTHHHTPDRTHTPHTPSRTNTHTPSHADTSRAGR